MKVKPSTAAALNSLKTSLLIYAGVLFTILASMFGLVFEPERQLGGQELAEVVVDPVLGTMGEYPVPLDYNAELGRKVYQSMGCVYCHSQQVRPEGFGADIDRGWGTRRTVSRDYLFDSPHLLGTMRTGPDLANIAVRQPSYEWHHLHLYDPRITSPGSIMPSFRFMYRKGQLRAREKLPRGAIALPETNGEYIFPKSQAGQLYSYLMTLNKSAPLPEATQ
jgi:cytochrome c oxidase cbb3-type subunit 2